MESVDSRTSADAVRPVHAGTREEGLPLLPGGHALEDLHAWSQQRRFEPPWWLRQPDLQTCWYVIRELAVGLRAGRITPDQIWSFVVGREKNYFSTQRASPPPAPGACLSEGGRFTTREVEIPLDDGGCMTALLDRPASGDGRLAILLHGLEGSAEATYMRGTGARLAERGITALRVNMINCGGSEARSRRFYHAGCTPMPAFAVSWALREGFEALALVGFSLGGNVVLKYLGEPDAIPVQLRGGAAVSVPMDLSSSCERIDQPRNKFYRYRFLKAMFRTMRRKQELFPDVFPVPIQWVPTIREFDHRYTAPANGFGSAAEYYQRASSISVLHAIRCPTLVLQAKDDLYIPFAAFDSFDWSRNSNLIPLFPPHGGHLGFHVNARQNWMEMTLADFCDRLLGPTESQIADRP